MLGWSRLSRAADDEESDVNLLSADELLSSSEHPQSSPEGPSVPDGDDLPPVLLLPVRDPDSGTTTRGSDGRSSRHRSGGGGGGGGRRHRGHSRHRLCRFKRREGDFLTAVSCMFVVVLVSTSLAEPHWFYLIGGKCTDYGGQPVNYLGVKLFFYNGYFKASHTSTSLSVYHYGSAYNEVLINCVTPSLVFSMRVIISLCVLVILFSVVAFVLHLLESSHRVLRSIRSNAIFSIISVIICIVINGLSYLVVEQMASYFQANPFHEGSRIDVEFSLGFYMITSAGAMSIIGVACNLLRRTMSHSRREHHGDQRPIRHPPPANPYPSVCSQPAPPPYTP